jgi:hypothetical protein
VSLLQWLAAELRILFSLIGLTIHCSDQLIIFVTDILIAMSDCICFSNMTSFTGYINNTVIKLQIYFNPHIHIFNQIINIISKWFHVFTQNRGAYNHKNTCIFPLHSLVLKKYWRQPSINFYFCNLSSSGDIVYLYKEHWWHWHKLVTDLFFVSILLV